MEQPKPLLDIEAIKKILPHRYPFLLIDKVISMTQDEITAVKNVTVNEPFFVGHFPQKSIMPGVLIVEAMAQAAGILGLRRGGDEGKLAFLAGIDETRFKKPVVPGDTLVFRCSIVKEKAKLMFSECEASVDGQVVCHSKIIFALVE